MTVASTQMLYDLFTDKQEGISIVADDDSTILTPLVSVSGTALVDDNPSPSSLIYVMLHPYPQENDPSLPVPLVVIGPALNPVMATQSIGYGLTEYHQTVEVRVLTRTIDSGYPFKLDGDLTRRKIVDNIKVIVQNSKSDPTGDGTFDNIRIASPGRDTDVRQGVPLYRTHVLIECVWFE